MMYRYLTDIEKNIEDIKKRYKGYKDYEKKLESVNKSISEFEGKRYNDYLIHILNNFDLEARYKNTLDSDNIYRTWFINEHPSLKGYMSDLEYKKIYSDLMFDKLNFINNKEAQYCVLNDTSKKYIIDLYNKEMIDVTNVREGLLTFIIMGLQKNGYVLNITPDDLPLLMFIKEELDINFDARFKNIADIECLDDDFNRLERIKYDVYLEYVRAKMVDEKVTLKDHIIANIPFVYDSNTQIKLWEELDEKKNNMTEDEYLLEYYKLLILFDNDIDKLYMEAEEDKKKYVIDAYYYFATTNDYDKHFKVSSSFINTLVLKKKYMKTKN